ncbi:MAG: DUF4465 domain-containing protein [Pirellulales bacterium]|nr:DUF4465 domain-containing protein [Pirellulales bacterium]
MTKLHRGLTMAALAVAGTCLFGSSAPAGVATFDDLSLSSESYWNGSDKSGAHTHYDYYDTYGYTVDSYAGGFSSGGAFFVNNYAETYYPDYQSGYTSWDGWAYSNMTDAATPGYNNQYSAITGAGVDGSANYGVAFESWTSSKTINFASPVQVQGAYVTNTAYAYYSMLNGDDYAKKFGGDDGTDEDWFKLTITGYDDAGTETGSVEFLLADYTFADGADDYIVDEWTWVDMTSLGDNVCKMGFSWTSTDNDPLFGMNTPAYFAMDNLTVVPEPGTLALLIAGLAALLIWRRRK